MEEHLGLDKNDETNADDEMAAEMYINASALRSIRMISSHLSRHLK